MCNVGGRQNRGVLNRGKYKMYRLEVMEKSEIFVIIGTANQTVLDS